MRDQQSPLWRGHGPSATRCVRAWRPSAAITAARSCSARARACSAACTRASGVATRRRHSSTLTCASVSAIRRSAASARARLQLGAMVLVGSVLGAQPALQGGDVTLQPRPLAMQRLDLRRCRRAWRRCRLPSTTHCRRTSVVVGARGRSRKRQDVPLPYTPRRRRPPSRPSDCPACSSWRQPSSGRRPQPTSGATPYSELTRPTDLLQRPPSGDPRLHPAVEVDDVGVTDLH